MTKEWCENLTKSRIGRHWYNNGINENFLYECPEGWTQGRLKRGIKTK